MMVTVIIKVKNKDIYVSLVRDILLPPIIVILLVEGMNCWKAKGLEHPTLISSQVIGTPIKGSTTT